MNKEEYLHSLEHHLKKYLSKSEICDILRDYGEYFEDGRRQNKSDTEISAKLGTPEMIAQQFIEEYQSEKKEIEPEEPLQKRKGFSKDNFISAKGKAPLQVIFKTIKKAILFIFQAIWHCLSAIFKIIKSTIGAGIGFVKSSFTPLKKLTKLIFRILFHAIYLFIVGICEFFLAIGVGIGIFATGASLFFCLFGIMFTIGSIDFISPFFIAAGIFASVGLGCIGLLLGTFLILFIRIDYLFLKRLLLNYLKKMDLGVGFYV